MIKVIQCGLGAMGSLMASIVLEKSGMQLVGAIERRTDLHGKDLGEYLGDDRAKGVAIYPDFASVPHVRDADVVLAATGSFLELQIPIVESAAAEGLNMVSIAEEMAYPAAKDPRAAERLDGICRECGVTVLGTGINPGFVLDLLILTLTGVCRRVDRIYAERVNDLSPYGRTVMETQGIGLSGDRFEQALADGSVVGHIGFQQSIRMIADALGLELDAVEEERAPIIAASRRRGKEITVEPGMVAGCRHTARGMRAGETIIELVHPQQVEPAAEGQKTWDLIRIEGEPPIQMRIEPETAGGIGTASLAVNMVPLVVAAEPGLVSMKDLPAPRLAALMPA